MTWAPEMKQNELEMTNLVIQQRNSGQQRPAVNWLTHTSEMENGKIENDDKLTSFTPMQL